MDQQVNKLNRAYHSFLKWFLWVYFVLAVIGVIYNGWDRENARLIFYLYHAANALLVVALLRALVCRRGSLWTGCLIALGLVLCFVYTEQGGLFLVAIAKNSNQAFLLTAVMSFPILACIQLQSRFAKPLTTT